MNGYTTTLRKDVPMDHMTIDVHDVEAHEVSASHDLMLDRYVVTVSGKLFPDPLHRGNKQATINLQLTRDAFAILLAELHLFELDT